MLFFRRFLAMITLIAPSLLLFAPVGNAASLCCKCGNSVLKQTDICVKYNTGDFGSLATCTLSDAPNNPAFASLACDPIPLSPEACTPIGESPSGQCRQISDAATYTGANQDTAPDNFQPVVPNLEIDIPGLTFAREFTITGAGPEERLHIPFLSQYISAVYNYLIGVSIIAAAIMIVYGGFRYIIGGTFTAVSQGKEIITDAIVGLCLVLGLFTIVSTLSPEMAGLQSLKISYVATVPFTPEEEEDWADSAPEITGEKPRAICRSVEACRQMCNANSWPTEWAGIMDPKLALPIPDMPGIKGGGFRASAQVIEGLRRAGKYAAAKDGGYTIWVTSGYRPLRTQIHFVCQKMGNRAKEALIGKGTAWPGASNHGAGTAVDVALYDNKAGKFIVESGNCEGQRVGKTATKEASKLFDEIMTTSAGGGGVRYTNESWHYEFGSTTKTCRCTFPNCDGPPLACTQGCQ